jgi:hypothetical protein
MIARAWRALWFIHSNFADMCYLAALNLSQFELDMTTAFQFSSQQFHPLIKKLSSVKWLSPSLFLKRL